MWKYAISSEVIQISEHYFIPPVAILHYIIQEKGRKGNMWEEKLRHRGRKEGQGH